MFLISKYHQIVEGGKQQLIYSFDNMEENLKSLAEELSEAAEVSGEGFPFVSSMFFERKAARARKRTGIEFFAYAPFVSSAQQVQWMQYAESNVQWYPRSLDQFLETSQQTDGSTSGGANVSTLTPFIWQYNDNSIGPTRASGPGPFAPLWHTSPPPASISLVNLDLLSVDYIRRLVPVVNETREVLFSEVIQDITSFVDIGAPDSDEGEHHAADEAHSHGWEHPHSAVFVPVFGRPSGSRSQEMVGIIVGVLPWDIVISNLFPAEAEGIFFVLSNTCGQSFSYFVRNETVSCCPSASSDPLIYLVAQALYLGPGDLHDSSFGYTKVDSALSITPDLPEEQVRLSCRYNYSLYSSHEFIARATTDLPMIFTILVSLVFVSTMLIFCMYDCFVRRRNEKVVNAAAQSNAIISSLFPTNVRDRLFQEAKENRQQTKQRKGTAPKSSLSSMLKSGSLHETGGNGDDDDDDYMYKSKPIADLFPETTILFADIAGKFHAVV